MAVIDSAGHTVPSKLPSEVPPASLSALANTLAPHMPFPGAFLECDDNTDPNEVTTFFTDIADNNRGVAVISGSVIATSQIVFRPTTGDTPATKLIVGNLLVKAPNSPTTSPLMLVDGFRGCNWIGELSVQGSGTWPVPSRQTQTGVEFQRSATGRIDTIRARYMQGFGVKINGQPTKNTGLMRIGQVIGEFCGTVPAGYAYDVTTAWSRVSRSGSSGSVGQTETVGVATLPPSNIDERFLFLVINGEFHRVTSLDRVGATAVVYPWVKTTASTAVDAVWHWGGVLLEEGSDGGVAVIQQINGTNSGIAHASAALFASHVGQLAAQACGVGVLYGALQASQCISPLISSAYFELNDADILVNCQNLKGGVVETAVIEADKILQCFVPLQSNDLPAPNAGGALNGLRVGTDTGVYKGATNIAYGQSNPTSAQIHLGKQPSYPSFHANSFIFHLQPFDATGNAVAGYDYDVIRCYGTAGNGVPTGSFTFNVPSGATINGAAGPLVIGSLTKPPVFNVAYRAANNNYIVANTAE